MAEDDVELYRTRDVYQVVAARTNKAEQEGRMIHLDGAKTNHQTVSNVVVNGNGDNAAAPAPATDCSLIIGRRVRKRFEQGWFFGTIVERRVITEDIDIDIDNNEVNGECSNTIYHVLYDDGDNEDMVWEELESWIYLADKFRHEDPQFNKKQQQQATTTETTTTSSATTTSSGSSSVTNNNPASPVRVKREREEERLSTVVTPPKKKRDPPPRYDASTCKSDIPWVCEMAKWLETQNMSQTNGRSVLRQVDKLAHGWGIGYGGKDNWPDDVLFLCGQCITLQYKFDPIMEQARFYESKYGRDKGNGWLLRHPIKKLQLYQSYCDITPTLDAVFFSE